MPELREIIDDVVNGYIACLIWTEEGFCPEPSDIREYPLSDNAIAQINRDVIRFLLGNEKDCFEYGDICLAHSDLYIAPANLQSDSVWESIGQDFWLTRNGYGTGFWDRGLDDLGDRLTSSAQDFGTCEVFLSGDGEIEILR